MKILHLPYSTSQMTIMCNALKDTGADATSCNFISHSFGFEEDGDLCLHLDQIDSELEKQKRINRFYEEAVKEYDVFHFHFSSISTFPDQKHLDLLKKHNKKLVLQHRGSEVRKRSLAKKMNPYVTVKPYWNDETRIDSLLNRLSKTFEHIIVADYELHSYVKDYYKYIHIIPQVIDIRNLKPSYPSPGKLKPLIVHAPSHQGVKGTEYVLNAVKKLQNEGYAFDFKLIEQMNHKKALEYYQKADLIIDQLRIGAFGILSLEGMALGKPVICYIRPDLLKKYPEHLPIVNSSPDTIYDRLKELIMDPAKRYDLGVQGRKYAEKHHNPEKIARYLMNVYKQL
ncbi:MAG: glycosyltransferase family 4 protein [Bacillaceae bacterium]|nr:glycosyltransferase family 4 protein [Bacillaceae bacterium]